MQRTSSRPAHFGRGALVRRVLVSSAFLLAIVAAMPARAALGEDADSVRADVAGLSGTLVVIAQVGYIVHELQLAGGTQVREYLSAAGNVFAVTWRGRSAPNLRLVLGRYYAHFVEAAQRPHADHHHLSIDTPELVLHAVRQPRALVGVAYLPSALPVGVSARELR